MKKLLNIGIRSDYEASLARKIRVSNLIAIITAITMMGFFPMSLTLHYLSAQLLIIFFFLASISNFVFHHFAYHQIAFFSFSIAGYIYFFVATVLFGINSYIHFFYLAMCMIAVVIFDKKWVIYTYIITAIMLIFILIWLMHDRQGLLIINDELREIQDFVGNIILLLLFVITSIFLIFFKSENLNYQRNIIAQKKIIEEKHREITDSINYAERIQRSFLATQSLLDQHLKDYFVYFQPKDVVSGDFYWASYAKISDPKGSFLLMCADSTGHGVPGAIMSILNISSLEKAIETESSPDKILDLTRKLIIERLKKDGSRDGGKDGMDGSLLLLTEDRSRLLLSSAHNTVLIVRKGEVIEIKGDKMPIGKHEKDQVSFTLHQIDLHKGDVIYTFTDGFPDQFGGEKGKKFMIRNLKDLFIRIASLPMKQQQQELESAFYAWKGNNEQIDDVCIVGVRV